MPRRRTPPAARALVRSLRAQGRPLRAIVQACAALGHAVSRSAVGRIVGPPPRRRAPKPRRPPAELLADAALRVTRSAGAEDVPLALAALDAARAQLADRLGYAPSR
jgi:hypothetical protein